jgi:hypothetical protein
VSQLVRRGSRKASMAAGALLKQLQVEQCISAIGRTMGPAVRSRLVNGRVVCGINMHTCHM